MYERKKINFVSLKKINNLIGFVPIISTYDLVQFTN